MEGVSHSFPVPIGWRRSKVAAHLTWIDHTLIMCKRYAQCCTWVHTSVGSFVDFWPIQTAYPPSYVGIKRNICVSSWNSFKTFAAHTIYERSQTCLRHQMRGVWWGPNQEKSLVCVTLGPTGGVRGSSGVGSWPHGPHMAMSRIRKLWIRDNLCGLHAKEEAKASTNMKSAKSRE